MKDIAILIPCYNEELTIGKVVKDIKKELKDVKIYVYDNNSSDKSVEIAKKSGAIVRHEYNQGKGNVMRRMFREIDADIYVIIDADDTYPASQIKELIEPIVDETADMVVGDRLSNGSYKKENKRVFHGFGNRLVKFAINKMFHSDLHDIMSGFRAFSKTFVKNMPVLSSNFEIETEMTIFALDKKFIIKEIPIDYKDRPDGSKSKLNTFRDGFKVLKTILKMYKDYKPLRFFSYTSGLIALIGLLVGIPVIIEYIQYQYVFKVPSAILATGLMIIALITFQCGIILETIVKHHKEEYEYRLIDYEKDN